MQRHRQSDNTRARIHLIDVAPVSPDCARVVWIVVGALWCSDAMAQAGSTGWHKQAVQGVTRSQHMQWAQQATVPVLGGQLGHAFETRTHMSELPCECRYCCHMPGDAQYKVVAHAGVVP